MNKNAKSSSVLSDMALERVMRDVLNGIWEISAEKAKQELAKADTAANLPHNESDKTR